VRLELADLVQIVGIAPKREFDARTDAHRNEVGGRFVGVEVDLGCNAVLLK